MIPKFLIPILLIIVAVILRLQQKKKKNAMLVFILTPTFKKSEVGSLRNSRFFPNADKLLKKNANYSGAKRGNKKIQGYACATSADHTACNLHPSPSPDLAALYVHSNHPGLCLGYLSC